MNTNSNTKRAIFWVCFIVVLGLIVWGLVAAMNKSNSGDLGIKAPPEITAADHVQGSASSTVTLVEYSDFQCPACEAYYPLITRLMTEFGSSTRLVYRHFPLEQHKNAVAASLASEAASEQGKFWQMYDLLFTNHLDWTEKTDPSNVFLSYAKQLDLNTDKFTSDMKRDDLLKKIMASRDSGQDIGIGGTPTFFVNGKAIRNPQSYEEFKTIIEQAIAKSSK